MQHSSMDSPFKQKHIHRSGTVWRLHTELALSSGAAGAEVVNMAHEAEPKKEPCQFFAAGKCVFGDACRNAHVNPEQEAKEEAKRKMHPIYARMQAAEANAKFEEDRCSLEVRFPRGSTYPAGGPPLVSFRNPAMPRDRLLQISVGLMRHAQSIWEDYRGPIIYELALWLESDDFARLLAEGCDVPPQLCEGWTPAPPPEPPALAIPPAASRLQEEQQQQQQQQQQQNAPSRGKAATPKAPPSETAAGASFTPGFWDVDVDGGNVDAEQPSSKPATLLKQAPTGVRQLQPQAATATAAAGLDDNQMARFAALKAKARQSQSHAKKTQPPHANARQQQQQPQSLLAATEKIAHAKAALINPNPNPNPNSRIAHAKASSSTTSPRLLQLPAAMLLPPTTTPTPPPATATTTATATASASAASHMKTNLTPEQAHNVSQHLLEELCAKRNNPAYLKLLKQRRQLPAFERMQSILEVIDAHQIVVISGSTGCGKTTQVPQFILDALTLRRQGGQCNIVCTQPRRISAIGVANRVADERLEPVGQSVGYQIRMEAKRSRMTRLLFCTTGILLRRLENDPLLRGTSHVVVDEVHERSLESDFLLMVLRDLMKSRPEFKVILMSATINQGLFSDYFGGLAKCPVIDIPGRSFPVDGLFLEDALEVTRYVVEPYSEYAVGRGGGGGGGGGGDNGQQQQPPAEPRDYKLKEGGLKKRYPGKSRWTIAALQACAFDKVNLDLVLSLLEWICAPAQQKKDPGAVLVFLPGFAEIRRVYEAISAAPFFNRGGGGGGGGSLHDDQRQWNTAGQWVGKSQFMVLPLHGSMSGEEQARVFTKPPRNVTKIVLSTNLAETSITIDDVVWVVDGGRMKETQYDPAKKMSSLVDANISRANGLQRRGRAGRVKPGKCFHLVTSHTWSLLAANQEPEIFRVPLEQISLRIKTLSFLEVEAAAAATEKYGAAVLSKTFKKGKKPEFQKGKGVMGVMARVIEPPKMKAVKSSLDTLRSLHALDKEEKLTPLGQHLANLPVDCRIGKMVLFGAMFNCLDPVLTMAACLSYRSPFVAPFDKLEEANLKKETFCLHGESSDHLAMLRAYQGWLASGCRISSQRQYCSENFLSHRTLTMLADVKRQLVELLSEIGFVTAGLNARAVEGIARRSIQTSNENSDGVIEATGEEANANNANTELLKAVLCAALYPNIVMADFPRGGAKKREDVKYKTKTDPRVALHPGSVCFPLTDYNSPYLIYLEKVKTSQIYVRDVTMVSAYPLLLFGGQVAVLTTGGRVVLSSDSGFVRFPVATERVAILLQELKSALVKLLQDKVSSPELQIGRSPVVATIIDLLSHGGGGS